MIKFSNNTSQIKRFLKFGVAIGVLVVLLTGCAPTVSVEQCIQNDLYGFWGGLWHGIIAPISFLLSLFMDDVAMYAVNNSGSWYDFGFVLGAGILFGGGGKAS
jgi:hypothetical protein